MGTEEDFETDALGDWEPKDGGVMSRERVWVRRRAAEFWIC